MAKVIIFGVGDIAELAYYYFLHDSEHEVIAFTVDKNFKTNDEFCGLPVIAFENIQEHYPPTTYDMFIAVGYARLNGLRKDKYFAAKSLGYTLVSYVSSKATVWPDLAMGENCFILEDNTIQPFVTLGNNVILWSGNHIGHHAMIKDNCFLASQVVISGGVTVEENCFIGVNATIRNHITIAKNNIIGAGAIILKNTPENAVYISKQSELAKISSDRLDFI